MKDLGAFCDPASGWVPVAAALVLWIGEMMKTGVPAQDLRSKSTLVIDFAPSIDMSSAEQFRRNASNTLANEICTLSGAGFETWCYQLIQHLEASVASWNHRGTTSLGAPVGHTVDSSGDHATVVAQYSSQRGYFGSSKPIDDLNSTLKKHPHAKQIWLLAAVAAQPSERTNCDNAIAEWKHAHPGISVEDLDARQIAEAIVDRLDSDQLVHALETNLPSLLRIADENSFSHGVPKTNGDVSRPEQEQEIRGALTKNRYAIVGGMSGIGKTSLAACVARGFDAETVIWLDATDVDEPEKLRAVPVGRRGLTHNLPTILRDRRTLLVLDNLQRSWSSEDYLSLAGSRSFVLSTTQFAGDRKDVIQVSSPSVAEARQIIDSEAGTACPEEVFKQILAATGGHPLILRVLAGLVKAANITWDSVLDVLPTIISHGEDERAVKICERVLQKHLPALRDELGVFVWADTPRLDAEFLSAAVSPLAAFNLEKRHFLALELASSKTVRLHDIVRAAARAVLDVTPEQGRRYRKALVGLLTIDDSSDTAGVDRIGRSHPDLIVRELAQESDWGLMYAASRARLRKGAIGAFGNLPELAAKAFERGGNLGIRAVIEAVEASFSLTSEYEGAQAAKALLSNLMVVFDVLATTVSLSPTIARDIRHHQAKMLMRLGDKEAAEKAFRALLLEDPDFDAAKLQVARLVGKKSHEEAVSLCKGIISSQSAGPTLRIPAWVELAQLEPSTVAESVGEIVGQLEEVDAREIAAAYGLVAQVASRLAFEEPDTTLALFRAIEDGEPSFSSDRERCDWARAQLSAAKASRERGDEPSFERLLQGATDTYAAVLPERVGNFHRVQQAEALILQERFPQASATLDLSDNAGRTEFWYHRRAQAARGMHEYESALTHINSALESLSDIRFRSAFLEERFRIRDALGDSAAAEDLEAAIDGADNAKYRARLSERLSEFTRGRTDMYHRQLS